MPTYTRQLGDSNVRINAPTRYDAIDETLWRSFTKANRVFGLDVESLPLADDSPNMYSQSREWLRLVQLGNGQEVWVLDPTIPHHRRLLREVFEDRRNLFITWSAIDTVCVKVCLGVDVTSRYFDGLTLALLLAPGELESHGLKDVTASYGMPQLSEAERIKDERFIALRPSKPPKPSVSSFVIKPRKPRKPGVKQRKTAFVWEAYEAELKEWELKCDAAKLDAIEKRDAALAQWEENCKPHDEFNGWRDVDSGDEAYVTYAGLDAVAAFRVWALLINSIKEKGLYRAVPTELWLQQSVTRMQLRGMKVDRAFAENELDIVGSKFYEAKGELEDLTQLKAGSVRRAAWLQERGIEFDSFTENGAPSLKAQHVGDLLFKYKDRECDESARQALELIKRVAETTNTTRFITTLLGFLDDNDRVHCNIRTLGAVTGRWTVNRPALQTLANRSKVRGCFIPDAHCTLVSIDFSQIEVRVAAALANEKLLIDAFARGEDGYDAVTTVLFGLRKGQDGFGRMRKIAKRVILATLYGAGVDTIIRQCHDLDGIDVDRETVTEVRSNFRRQYSKIQDMAKKLNTGKDVWLPSGRMVPGDSERTYRGINSACQGAARDVLVDAMYRAREFEHMMLLGVHDEVLFNIPNDVLNDVIVALLKAFEQPFRSVPVRCDVEMYSERWGFDKQDWSLV